MDYNGYVLCKTTGEIKEAMVSISSILNKHGIGTLYFGVKPSGNVIGQDVSESSLRDVSMELPTAVSCYRMKFNKTNINKDRKKQVDEMQIAGLSCKLYIPIGYNDTQKHYPVIYVNGEIPVEEVINAVRKAGVDAEFLLLSIQPNDWNDDFTPWGAPAFRKGEEAPAGKADNYIRCLTEEIKPFMDANYRTKPEPEHTVLFGYSLGGLAALYACYKTELFGVVGSLSGSLWYDNFCEYMEQNKPLREDLKVYLSLGRKECMSKNPRMGKVAECTEQAREILMRQLEKVYFEWNDGGHFHEIPKRFAKAIAWWACSL